MPGHCCKRNAKMKNSYPLNINDPTINSTNNLKLLGIEIDNKLFFGQHISTLCNKASNQLNVIGRIQKFMGFKEKEVHNSFVYSAFLLIEIFIKIEKKIRKENTGMGT